MNLKIFKLRSGEEIICVVLEEMKTKYKIKDPFVFKSSTTHDKIASYDMTILRDWLSNSEVKTVTIPKNHITLEIIPNADTVKLYELQLESEKSVQEKIVTEESNEDDHHMDAEKILNDFLSSMMNDISGKMPYDEYMQDDYLSSTNSNKAKRNKNKRKNTSKSPSFSPEISPGELDRHGIYVTMMIPSESIMNLITAGILNPKDLLQMISEVKRKNRFSGDEKDRQDFGNKLSDWNPDPESGDYK
jgi:hypothetical protein